MIFSAPYAGNQDAIIRDAGLAARVGDPVTPWAGKPIFAGVLSGPVTLAGSFLVFQAPGTLGQLLHFSPVAYHLVDVLGVILRTDNRWMEDIRGSGREPGESDNDHI